MNAVSDCCGAPCVRSDDPDEPCYGEVDVVDEVQAGTDDDPDWAWIHACEGHNDWPGPYVPKENP